MENLIRYDEFLGDMLLTRADGIAQRFYSMTFSPRQTKLLHRLLNGFTGNLTTSKWTKIAKCSSDTALRDMQDLVDKKILSKAAGGGRSTHYRLTDF